jgi:dihydropyrimidinase
MDLAIRGGEIVTAGSRFRGDVGVSDGRIVQLGGSIGEAQEEIDATGRLVLPGGVDMHVHLTPAYVPESEGERPGEQTFWWADDFRTGSHAAAAGGITTIGNMTFSHVGETPLEAVQRVEAEAARESIVDFVLHPVLIDAGPRVVENIPLLAEAGYGSIKIFMMFETFDVHVREYVNVMRVAGQHGLLTLLHCEDACVVSLLAERMLAAGTGDPSNYGASRPRYAEAVSVARAVAFCEATEAPIYIVHLSTREGLEVAHQARARGLPVFVETRPVYLFFDETFVEGAEGGLYISTPPLREAADQDALWGGILTGAVHTCCTDHAPALRHEKLDPSRDVTNVSPGMADLDTYMPLLFSEGVRTGRISLERFVDVTATNAAKLFGLYPRKGTIAVGGDADIVIWDPDATRTFSHDMGHSRADFSLYEGREITGWPVVTISRGEVIFQDGEIRGPAGRGRRVWRRSPEEHMLPRSAVSG